MNSEYFILFDNHEQTECDTFSLDLTQYGDISHPRHWSVRCVYICWKIGKYAKKIFFVWLGRTGFNDLCYTIGDMLVWAFR